MEPNKPFAYHRPSLAKSYCDALAGVGILNATSGLFLAAPRRTGKSTFLREDLVPHMIERGWEPIYVDLWVAKTRDPADLIADAIRDALAKYDGIVLKAAKQVGLDKLSVLGTLSLDLTRIGQPGGATLASALSALRERCGKPLALLIDEAQHALATEAGVNAMFALKAARDHLNQGQPGGKLGLHIVMTGSNRDKLAHLVLRRSEPFYGAGITIFPLLDNGFAAAYGAWLNQQFKDGFQFSIDALETAFELVGRRPEMLNRIVGEAVSELGGAKGLDALLANNATQLRQQAWSDFESTCRGLTPTQRAVLDVVARLAPSYEPFSEEAQKGYQAILGQPLSTSSVQAALASLREQELLWRAGRGDYAFEDDGFRTWYLLQHESPPSLADDG